MLVFTGFLRFVAGVFSCRHWGTRIHEGKCYCPDCGRGLIFQWAVLRCVQCHRRVESRLWFGRISPVQRCCARCGHPEVETDWLSAPAYFQLHKAQLVLVSEEDYYGYCDREPLGSACLLFRQCMTDWLTASVRSAVGQQEASESIVLPRLAVFGR